MEDMGLRLDVLLTRESDKRFEMEVLVERPVEGEGDADRGVEISELDEL